MPKAARQNRQKTEADNPEWSNHDFERAVPFAELPEQLRSSLKRRGRQRAPTKELISIRLSRDVVEQLRASGQGWQSRVDEHLRSWMQKQRVDRVTIKKKRPA
jgi:uncharacterized protein (DUF4415 family)